MCELRRAVKSVICCAMLLLKAPRPLLILEAVLLLAAVLFTVYKIFMRVPPLPVSVVLETRNRKPDAKAQIMEYYRKYPERYIRIADDSWSYHPVPRIASHSLKVRNTAAVTYTSVRLRFTYESAGGEVLKSEAVTLPGRLGALRTIELKKLEVRGVPAAAWRVTAIVEKASVAR